MLTRETIEDTAQERRERLLFDLMAGHISQRTYDEGMAGVANWEREHLPRADERDARRRLLRGAR